jgi:hypothetical protein
MTTSQRPQFQHKTGRLHDPAAGSGKGGKPATAEQRRTPIVARDRLAHPGFTEYGIIRS